MKRRHCNVCNREQKKMCVHAQKINLCVCGKVCVYVLYNASMHAKQNNCSGKCVGWCGVGGWGCHNVGQAPCMWEVCVCV